MSAGFTVGNGKFTGTALDWLCGGANKADGKNDFKNIV